MCIYIYIYMYMCIYIYIYIYIYMFLRPRGQAGDMQRGFQILEQMKSDTGDHTNSPHPRKSDLKQLNRFKLQ